MKTGMSIGQARAIFENLDKPNCMMECKGLAIRTILDMATHNSITKAQLLKAMDWMWNQIYEIEEETQDD